MQRYQCINTMSELRDEHNCTVKEDLNENWFLYTSTPFDEWLNMRERFLLRIRGSKIGIYRIIIICFCILSSIPASSLYSFALNNCYANGKYRNNYLKKYPFQSDYNLYNCTSLFHSSYTITRIYNSFFFILLCLDKFPFHRSTIIQTEVILRRSLYTCIPVGWIRNNCIDFRLQFELNVKGRTRIITEIMKKLYVIKTIT